ncbi:hypothetical protein PS903_05819 [Pseudomonas fluorescens]|nr:hypothetical protein PS903_05819 [Pseudomonas fluorescens]
MDALKGFNTIPGLPLLSGCGRTSPATRLKEICNGMV